MSETKQEQPNKPNELLAVCVLSGTPEECLALIHTGDDPLPYTILEYTLGLRLHGCHSHLLFDGKDAVFIEHCRSLGLTVLCMKDGAIQECARVSQALSQPGADCIDWSDTLTVTGVKVQTHEDQRTVCRWAAEHGLVRMLSDYIIEPESRTVYLLGDAPEFTERCLSAGYRVARSPPVPTAGAPGAQKPKDSDVVCRIEGVETHAVNDGAATSSITATATNADKTATTTINTITTTTTIPATTASTVDATQESTTPEPVRAVPHLDPENQLDLFANALAGDAKTPLWALDVPVVLSSSMETKAHVPLELYTTDLVRGRMEPFGLLASVDPHDWRSCFLVYVGNVTWNGSPYRVLIKAWNMHSKNLLNPGDDPYLKRYTSHVFIVPTDSLNAVRTAEIVTSRRTQRKKTPQARHVSVASYTWTKGRIASRKKTEYGTDYPENKTLPVAMYAVLRDMKVDLARDMPYICNELLGARVSIPAEPLLSLPGRLRGLSGERALRVLRDGEPAWAYIPGAMYRGDHIRHAGIRGVSGEGWELIWVRAFPELPGAPSTPTVCDDETCPGNISISHTVLLKRDATQYVCYVELRDYHFHLRFGVMMGEHETDIKQITNLCYDIYSPARVFDAIVDRLGQVANFVVPKSERDMLRSTFDFTFDTCAAGYSFKSEVTAGEAADISESALEYASSYASTAGTALRSDTRQPVPLADEAKTREQRVEALANITEDEKRALRAGYSEWVEAVPAETVRAIVGDDQVDADPAGSTRRLFACLQGYRLASAKCASMRDVSVPEGLSLQESKRTGRKETGTVVDDDDDDAPREEQPSQEPSEPITDSVHTGQRRGATVLSGPRVNAKGWAAYQAFREAQRQEELAQERVRTPARVQTLPPARHSASRADGAIEPRVLSFPCGQASCRLGKITWNIVHTELICGKNPEHSVLYHKACLPALLLRRLRNGHGVACGTPGCDGRVGTLIRRLGGRRMLVEQLGCASGEDADTKEGDCGDLGDVSHEESLAGDTFETAPTLDEAEYADARTPQVASVEASSPAPDNDHTETHAMPLRSDSLLRALPTSNHVVAATGTRAHRSRNRVRKSVLTLQGLHATSDIRFPSEAARVHSILHRDAARGVREQVLTGIPNTVKPGTRDAAATTTTTVVSQDNTNRTGGRSAGSSMGKSWSARVGSACKNNKTDSTLNATCIGLRRAADIEECQTAPLPLIEKSYVANYIAPQKKKTLNARASVFVPRLCT